MVCFALFRGRTEVTIHFSILLKLENCCLLKDSGDTGGCCICWVVSLGQIPQGPVVLNILWQSLVTWSEAIGSGSPRTWSTGPTSPVHNPAVGLMYSHLNLSSFDYLKFWSISSLVETFYKPHLFFPILSQTTVHYKIYFILVFSSVRLSKIKDRTVVKLPEEWKAVLDDLRVSRVLRLCLVN